LDRTDYRSKAEEVFLTIAGLMRQYASGFGRMLGALDFFIGPSKEIAIVGPPTIFIEVLRKHYRPRTVAAAGPGDHIALLRDRPMLNGKPTVYVCENFTCQQPVTDAALFEKQL
jgi:uncharacterized protein YyaL (SSP411 family)